MNIFEREVCREGSGMIIHGKKIWVDILVIVLAGSSEANRLALQIANPRFPSALHSPQLVIKASGGVIESWLKGIRCLNSQPLGIPAVRVGP